VVGEMAREDFLDLLRRARRHVERSPFRPVHRGSCAPRPPGTGVRSASAPGQGLQQLPGTLPFRGPET
jgi:hypothetical protein